MLGGAKLKVVYNHEKTCFAYISPKYSTNNEKSQCVQVLLRDKHVLLWVVYSSSVTEGQIACNPIFSRLVGLEEGWEVFVSPYGDVKVLDELYIDTDSPDDQEILEHNVELLQLRILDQLRLVVSNQKAVVWISTSLPIVFTPKQTGLLVTNSKIVVKVDAFNTFHAPPPTTSNVPKLEDSKLKNIGIINKGLLQPYLYTLDRLVLRALPIDSDGKKNLIHPYIVFIHEDLLGEKYNCTVVLATMQNIPSILQENNDNENNNNKVNDLCVEIVPVDSVVFKSLCHEDYNSNIHTVLIPKALNAIINIENGTRIIFTIIGDKVEQPEHIDLVTYSDMTQTESEVIEKFKNCVIENTHSGKKFLINDGVVKQNTQISKGFLQFKLKPEKLRYTLLNTESFRHCTVAAKCLTDCDLDIPKTSMSNLEYDYKNYCRTMKSMESLVQKIVSHAYFEIHREATFKNVSEIKSNILLTGLSGTGKSAICHIVQKELTLWTRVVQCRSLKGRKDIPEALSAAVLSCRERRPAVLVCDDVDALLPANTEGASPQDIAYYQRLAVVLKQLLQTCSGVCVLMTAQSVKALHPTLRQFSGKPLFTAHFDIPELEQEERTELFKHLLNEKIREEFSVEDDDVIKLAMDTAGSNVRDITDYLNKKIFKAVKKKKANPDTKPRLVEDVTKDVEKKSAFDIWEPVGGLDDVKRELTECIFWPMMYPALFPSQSCGILLYGPPGTGKSHIGSCLARVANMSLVAVKGPELLSKYIGQSEKAVRDIFDKADMKRPCILFFDEFDSLAPKRGHDSTGVTDRVVNQLLARLDGAEGGARGPVLAATSRPDLLDPALLRAGRLQRHVYCALPAQQGRYEVLRTLVKSVTVSDDVDLQDIASRTEGYSPADLKSLLVTAQLGRLETQLGSHVVLRTLVKSVTVSDDVDLQDIASRTEGYSPADLKSLLVTAQLGRLETQLVRRQHGRHVLRTLVKSVTVSDDVDLQDIASRTEGYSPADLKSLLVTAQLGRLETQLVSSEDRSMSSVVVQREDIEAALQETKPSLSQEQRLFYDMIYKRFRGENLSPEQRAMAMQMQKQRVTLA